MWEITQNPSLSLSYMSFSELLSKHERGEGYCGQFLKTLLYLAYSGIEQVEVRERGVKPGGTGAESPRIPKSLKLSLRGSVEIQAQHRPDRLKKPRTESVWTDRLGRVPSRLGPIRYAGSAQRTE